jgi:hypothetical protein
METEPEMGLLKVSDAVLATADPSWYVTVALTVVVWPILNLAPAVGVVIETFSELEIMADT